MNDQPAKTQSSSFSAEAERELFSEKKAAFIEALDCLYIRNNVSGRLMFAEKWPEIAEKIFSEELVRFDHDGVADDDERKRRTELEIESEAVRDAILNIFDGIEKRLVVHGSLRKEELDQVMAQIDRTLATYVFTERFVDRYFPLAPAPYGGEAERRPVPDSSLPVSSVPEVQVESLAPSPAGEGYGEEAALPPQPEQQAPQPVRAEVSSPHVDSNSLHVPDVPTNSIGHIDHSFNAGIVAGKPGDEEDTSWLNIDVEDEFGDVVPISVAVPQQQREDEQLAPAEDDDRQVFTFSDEPAAPVFAPIAPPPVVGAQPMQQQPVAHTPDQSSQPQTPQQAPQPPAQPALRVPSLDNLERDMEKMERKPDYPPIPGSEDDGR